MKKAFHKAGTRWLQYDTKYHTGGRCAQLVKKTPNFRHNYITD